MSVTGNSFGLGDHICPVCELIHETVPGCAGCSDYLNNQQWWMEVGRVQGHQMAQRDFQIEREHLQQEVVRLGGEITWRVRGASGPSFSQLSELRNQPNVAKAHARVHREIVARLLGVTDDYRRDSV